MFCSIVCFKGTIRDIEDSHHRAKWWTKPNKVSWCPRHHGSPSCPVCWFHGALRWTSGLNGAAATAGCRSRYHSNMSRLLFQRVVMSTICLCSLMSGPGSSFCFAANTAVAVGLLWRKFTICWIWPSKRATCRTLKPAWVAKFKAYLDLLNRLLNYVIFFPDDIFTVEYLN